MLTTLIAFYTFSYVNRRPRLVITSSLIKHTPIRKLANIFHLSYLILKFSHAEKLASIINMSRLNMKLTFCHWRAFGVKSNQNEHFFKNVGTVGNWRRSSAIIEAGRGRPKASRSTKVTLLNYKKVTAYTCTTRFVSTPSYISL